MAKVSVIIPSYNHAPFIGEAIDSVLCQDYTDFELLLADDHSSDNSVDVIKTYSDSRIQTFFLKENLGATQILQFLIEHATGEYIALLNSDDRWCPGKLTKQVNIMENHREYAACFTWADFIDEHGQPLSDDGTLNLNTFYEDNKTQAEWLNFFFYHGNCLCHPSVLIRKSVYTQLGYYNGALRQLPDFAYWVQLCIHSPIYIVEEILVNHRRTTGENKNTSAVCAENTKRVLSESAFIMMWMFQHTPDDLFVRAFHEHFIDKTVIGGVALVCEKYFLLIHNPAFGLILKNLACQFFMDQYSSKDIAKTFREKYHYSEQDFYKDHVTSLDGFAQFCPSTTTPPESESMVSRILRRIPKNRRSI